MMKSEYKIKVISALGSAFFCLMLIPTQGDGKSMWVTCPNSMGYEQCEAITVELKKAADAILPNGVMVAFTGNRRAAQAAPAPQPNAAQQQPQGGASGYYQGNAGYPYNGGFSNRLAQLPSSNYPAFNQQQPYAPFSFGSPQPSTPLLGYQDYPPQGGGFVNAYGQMPQMPLPIYNYNQGAVPGFQNQQIYQQAGQQLGGLNQQPNVVQQCQGRWNVQPEVQPNGMLGWVRVCQFVAPAY